MPVLRLFASAREAAGVARAEFPGTTVSEILDGARTAYGERFAAVVDRSRIWVNGEPASNETVVHGHDVVAVLPPVSGGAGGAAPVAERNARSSGRGAPGEPRSVGAERRAAGQAPPVAGDGRAAGEERRPVAGDGRRAAGEQRRPAAGDAPRAAGQAPPVAGDGRRAAGEQRRPAAGGEQRRPAGGSSSSAAMGGLGGGRDAGRRRSPLPEDSGGPPTRPVTPVDRGSAAARPGLQPDRRPTTNGAATATTGPRPAGPAAGRLVTLPGADADSPRPARPSSSATPPKPSPRSRGLGMGDLAVVYRTTRPHGRIGVLWAIVTVALTIQGQIWLAGWMSVIAFVGACQAVGARRGGGHKPPPALAAVLAAAAPIAAAYGVRYLVVVVGGGLGLALVTGGLGRGWGPRDLAVAIAVGAVLGATAAAPVVTRDLGIAPVLFLFACMATYDAGAYLVGTGASSAWEGPVAGMVALIPITLIGAIILSPPFPSGTPLGLGALAACLAPLGPLAGTALIGSREADAPGLRRLDSLILLGPVWAWFSTSLLR